MSIETKSLIPGEAILVSKQLGNMVIESCVQLLICQGVISSFGWYIYVIQNLHLVPIGVLRDITL